MFSQTVVLFALVAFVLFVATIRQRFTSRRLPRFEEGAISNARAVKAEGLFIVSGTTMLMAPVPSKYLREPGLQLIQ